MFQNILNYTAQTLSYRLPKPVFNSIYTAYSKLRGNYHYYLPYTKEFQATQITENLYIGDIYSLYQREFLKQNGITHVVSVVLGISPPYPNDFKYLTLNAIDEEKQNLIDKFDDAITFIDKAINENGKVLIHCICGVSRSVTICSAYLIYKNYYQVNEVIEMIKSKRKVANPNESFVEQLNIFYKNHSQNKIQDEYNGITSV